MEKRRPLSRSEWAGQLAGSIRDALGFLILVAESLEYEGSPCNDLRAGCYEDAIAEKCGLDRQLAREMAEAIHGYMERDGYL